MRSEKWTPLEETRKQKNALDQEQQFLQKRLAYLTTGNRENKVIAGLKRVKQAEAEYARADGPELYQLATQIVRLAPGSTTSVDVERLSKALEMLAPLVAALGGLVAPVIAALVSR